MLGLSCVQICATATATNLEFAYAPTFVNLDTHSERPSTLVYDQSHVSLTIFACLLVATCFDIRVHLLDLPRLSQHPTCLIHPS